MLSPFETSTVKIRLKSLVYDAYPYCIDRLATIYIAHYESAV